MNVGDIGQLIISLEWTSDYTVMKEYCSVLAQKLRSHLKQQSEMEYSNKDLHNFDPMNFTEAYIRPSSLRKNYSEIELKALEDKIGQAWKLIKQLSESLYLFVNVMTLRVEVWKEEEGGFGSTSTGDHLGRTILRNVHKDGCQIEIIAESLVHEAIHHALNIIELEYPIVKDQRLHFRQTVSRWSGQTIGAHAYIHACFVWYGIYHFYGLLIAKQKNIPKRCLLRKSHCARGFMNGTAITGHFDFAKSYVNRQYLFYAEKMRQRILQKCGRFGHRYKFKKECLKPIMESANETNIYPPTVSSLC